MPKGDLNKVYHVLNIPEKEQAFIQEIVGELRTTYILGKIARATGEATKGLVGHPAGLVVVVGLALAFLVALGIKKARDDGNTDAETRYEGFERSFLEAFFAGMPVDEEARIAGVDRILEVGRFIRDWLLGQFAPPPPPPGEAPPPFDPAHPPGVFPGEL